MAWVTVIDTLALGLSVILFAIPGVVLSLALFRRMAVNWLEKVLLGVILSTVLMPLLAILELVFFAVKLNGMLIFANFLLLVIIGIVAYAHQGMPKLEFSRPRVPFLDGPFDWQKDRDIVLGAALVLLLMLTFWVRFEPAWADNFFEFDPIFYSHVTEILVKNGVIPAESSEVYYPLTKDLRVYPIVPYLGAQIYTLYHAIVGGPFIKSDFHLAIEIYPPLVAVLTAFAVFLLFRRQSNDYVALIAAGTFATMPQLISKFGAGVNELQPWGLFSAVFVIAATFLAMSQKSYRFAVLAGVALFGAMLGTAQGLWPAAAVATYFLLHAFVSYWREELDGKEVGIYAIIAIPGILGTLMSNFYRSDLNMSVGSIIANSSTLFMLGTLQYLLIGAVAVAGFLLLVQRFVLPRLMNLTPLGKPASVAGMAVLLAMVFVAVPAVPGMLGNFLNSSAGFARQLSALGMTIAEENAVSPGLYFGAFGYLNPDILLPALALLITLLSFIKLLMAGRRIAAGAVVLGVLLITALNSFTDSALLWVANSFLSGYSLFTQFVTGNDLFVYMTVSIISLLLAMLLVKEDPIPSELLYLVIAIFPVAYIGLNKLKFMPHLALALAVAFPFALSIGLKIVQTLSAELKGESDRQFAFKATLAIVILIGGIALYAQSTTMENSMNGLRYTRISGDWMSSYEWMRTAPSFDKSFCQNTYGYDCRVLSWWDYGHWTTFFGEKKSVLDPGNRYPDFNQGTARAFVQGNLADLLYTVRYHQATHILVDAQLIQKWGALVFLSGSCGRGQYATCPEKPEIDFKNGAGRSTYEAEHYFEFLTQSGTCPAQLTGVALPAFKSSLTNAVYCFTDTEYLLLTQSGIDSNYKRKYKIVGRDQIDGANIAQDTAYLFGYTQGQFINVNPDLSYVGLRNNIINSVFTRLFFFENLPGMQLEQRSPSGEVKIFRILPEFISGSTLASSSTSGIPDLPTPTPTPEASPSPQATPGGNETNASPAPQGNATASGGNETQASPTPQASPTASPTPAATAAPSATPSPTP